MRKRTDLSNIELFVIGASAGGLEALRRIISKLPPDFPAAICVVVHVSADSPGLIPDILNAVGSLPAQHARHNERLAPGRVYVAPPDRHLIVGEDSRLRLGRGPKENRFRPAIDPLFRSAALVYRTRAAGVILSGGLDDGAAGTVAVQRCGGAVIIQDPDDAQVPSMPNAALRLVDADRCVPADGVAQAMVDIALTFEPAGGEECPVSDLDKEIRYAAGEEQHLVDVMALGSASMFTCPECQGVMVTVHDANPPRFRCHTGHAFTLRSLAEAVDENVEEILFSAARALEEHAALNQKLADLEHGGDPERRKALLAEAENAIRRANLVRSALKAGFPPPGSNGEPKS